jgi:hypothetical protein
MSAALRCLSGCLAASAWLFACGGGDGSGGGAPGTSGVNTGQSCVASDLIAQCPPGSQPDLSAQAVSACEGQADFLLSGDGGSIEAACRGSGECLVVCNFEVPCACGVDAITTEGVFCTPCLESAACGDAVCEGGEDATTCPVDCASSCTAGTRRCNGRDREDCNGQGEWEPVACRPDQACEVGPAGVACQANLSPSGGTYPGTGWQDVDLPTDPATVYFPEAQIGCGNTPGNCLPLAFVDDEHILGTQGGQLALLTTGDGSPESLPVAVDATARIAPAVDLPHVVSPARQPVLFNLNDRRVLTAEAVVDDVTDLAWGSAAVHAGTGLGAVGFAAAQQPFVALYELETGRVRAMLRYAESALVRPPVSLDFSADGALLAELRAEGLCIVWNVAEARHVRLIELESAAEGGGVDAVTVRFTRGNGPLLLISDARRVEVWHLDETRRVSTSGRGELDGFAGPFELSPDGRIAVALDQGFGGSRATFFVDSLAYIRSFNALENSGLVGPPGIFSPDGRRIAIGHLVFGAWAE